MMMNMNTAKGQKFAVATDNYRQKCRGGFNFAEKSSTANTAQTTANICPFTVSRARHKQPLLRCIRSKCSMEISRIQEKPKCVKKATCWCQLICLNSI